MQAISHFSLAQHPGAYETWPRTTRLFANGVATGAEVPGYVIEGQYRCAPGFLLILSQDCPFEESNTFMLLSPDLRVLAQAEVGAPYSSFLLHAHWPRDENSLCLHYSTRLFYRLELVRPTSLLRSGYRIDVRVDEAADTDPRCQASVAALEASLAEIRQSLGKDP